MFYTVPERDRYTFRIDGLTPETLPMTRLADYMAELARLMGESERVHFESLKRGSAVLKAYVESQAAPKVRRRLTLAQSVDAPDDIRRSYERLNQLLRSDNSRGDLTLGEGVRVAQFPGRDLPQHEQIGPFNENTEIDGQLVRIGGKDDTAHALIEDAEGRIRTCVVKRADARELAQHLYGPPLRVSGKGRWFRNEDGEWELRRITLTDFRVLRDEELATAVGRLREVEGSGWRDVDDPLALLSDLRESDEGAH